MRGVGSLPLYHETSTGTGRNWPDHLYTYYSISRLVIYTLEIMLSGSPHSGISSYTPLEISTQKSKPITLPLDDPKMVPIIDLTSSSSLKHHRRHHSSSDYSDYASSSASNQSHENLPIYRQYSLSSQFSGRVISRPTTPRCSFYSTYSSSDATSSEEGHDLEYLRASTSQAFAPFAQASPVKSSSSRRSSLSQSVVYHDHDIDQRHPVERGNGSLPSSPLSTIHLTSSTSTSTTQIHTSPVRSETEPESETSRPHRYSFAVIKAAFTPQQKRHSAGITAERLDMDFACCGLQIGALSDEDWREGEEGDGLPRYYSDEPEHMEMEGNWRYREDEQRRMLGLGLGLPTHDDAESGSGSDTSRARSHSHNHVWPRLNRGDEDGDGTRRPHLTKRRSKLSLPWLWRGCANGSGTTSPAGSIRVCDAEGKDEREVERGTGHGVAKLRKRQRTLSFGV